MRLVRLLPSMLKEKRADRFVFFGKRILAEAVFGRCPRHFRFTLDSDHITDIA